MQSEIYDFLLKHRKHEITGVWNGKVIKAKTIEEFWKMHNCSARPIVARVDYIDANNVSHKGLVGLGYAEEFFKDLLKEKDLPESLRNEIILCLACK